ncbi:hypothetical protein CTAYLR_007145 [Chrysophaeum taylorii]|uniref:Uncharacterized protein n=1 Tax=Chrysophaeum taylorii TaxID=2483200 RepID=A0AAD7UMB9_9STRA|nr:hypothetical protein CTAYLR_007145 [Chrysophaeum taylorii]
MRCAVVSNLVASALAVNVGRRFVVAHGALLPARCLARNLPESTGATGASRGDVTALVPIVRLRSAVEASLGALPDLKEATKILETVPATERDFKRLFDEFSDAVSYKQRFLDSNAFLVYYTQGFDGPGRPSIEADLNERETRQYGSRNDAWIAVDDARAELQYLLTEGSGDTADLAAMLGAAVDALDDYLRLAPPALLAEAAKEGRVIIR